MFFLVVFFFKQKTAYEVRISDWSSDVCSSDLIKAFAGLVHPDDRIGAAEHHALQFLAPDEIQVDVRAIVGGEQHFDKVQRQQQAGRARESRKPEPQIEVGADEIERRSDIVRGQLRSEEHKSELQSPMLH